MRDIALYVHILGWAQWMGAHLALAGLLRREALFEQDIGPRVARQFDALWVSLIAGGLVAVFGGLWLAKVNPAYARMGFFLTKILLVIIGFFVAIVPMRSAHQRLIDGGAPLHRAWFPFSLGLFLLIIGLGVFKPF